jgi:hypothetical protein
VSFEGVEMEKEVFLRALGQSDKGRGRFSLSFEGVEMENENEQVK